MCGPARHRSRRREKKDMERAKLMIAVIHPDLVTPPDRGRIPALQYLRLTTVPADAFSRSEADMRYAKMFTIPGVLVMVGHSLFGRELLCGLPPRRPSKGEPVHQTSPQAPQTQKVLGPPSVPAGFILRAHLCYSPWEHQRWDCGRELPGQSRPVILTAIQPAGACGRLAERRASRRSASGHEELDFERLF